MDGNEKVSSMIEALSTMLEATLNRKKQPMIPLREELAYVDAYCCIIKQRFGEKICFEKELDGVASGNFSPAPDHPADHRKRGGARQERDTGKNCAEHFQGWKPSGHPGYKRRRPDKGGQGAHRSASGRQSGGGTLRELGIRNVNKRLKIIYGESFGLTIKNDNEGHTVSTLVVGLQAARE